MSSIAAVFATGRTTGSAVRAQSLLRTMSHRGSERVVAWEGLTGAMAGGRHPWEDAPSLGWGCTMARRGPLIVVADAKLYYVRELKEALARHGVAVEADVPAELIAAAYEAWGGMLVHHLDGDYAFVIRDEARDDVLLARDHVGSRPLHVHETSATLTIASLARAVAVQPWVKAPVSDLMLAAAMGGLPGGSERTAFEGVMPVPAGAALRWTPGSGLTQVSRWLPPVFKAGGRPDFDEGARELQRLLTRAVAERSGPSVSVWLSGGADSTAVYGALQNARRLDPGVAPQVHAVTTSFAEGDLAREDEFVEAIMQRWGGDITWVDSAHTTILENSSALAAERDDPYAHTFQAMNIRMARASVAQSARIVMDGYGGDQLFQAADPYLADMALRLDWAEIRRSRRRRGVHGWRSLVKECLVPWLPYGLVAAIRRLRDPDEDWVLAPPNWVPSPPEAREVLKRWASFEPARHWFESPSNYEGRLYAESPYFPRAMAWNGTTGLAQGISLRSPLADRRVAEFAATRPVTERAYNGETKRLLRASMRGLLPEVVIAPRPRKTGVPSRWLRDKIRVEVPPLVHELLLGPSRPLLWQRGLLDVAALEDAMTRYLSTSHHITGVQLLLTLQVELWLRSMK